MITFEQLHHMVHLFRGIESVAAELHVANHPPGDPIPDAAMARVQAALDGIDAMINPPPPPVDPEVDSQGT